MNPEVGAWLAKADEDRAAARCLARADHPLLLPAVFHVQQSAEKYLKALLIGKGIDFGRKHDLAYLREMAQEPSLEVFSDFLDQLLLTQSKSAARAIFCRQQLSTRPNCLEGWTIFAPWCSQNLMFERTAEASRPYRDCSGRSLAVGHCR